MARQVNAQLLNVSMNEGALRHLARSKRLDTKEDAMPRWRMSYKSNRDRPASIHIRQQQHNKAEAMEDIALNRESNVMD